MYQLSTRFNSRCYDTRDIIREFVCAAARDKLGILLALYTNKY